MISKDLINLGANGHNRVKSSHRLLKNHRDFAAPYLPHPQLRGLGKIFVTKGDATLLHPYMRCR